MVSAVARLRVIYGDTDQMGVVYYANYLRFFEASRAELFRALGGSYAAMEREGFGLPVVEASLKYLAPARYEDVLLVTASIAQLRRVSVHFEYQVRREADQRLLCTGTTAHACVDGEGKVCRLPPSLLRLLAQAPAS